MARPLRATTPPANTSNTQWLAVATTATPMAIGIATAATRTIRHREVWAQATATSRFQPKCRLGTAAYLLTSWGGCRTR